MSLRSEPVSRPQGPVGQVSRGLGARAPKPWGPAHQEPGSNHDFSQTSLLEGVGVG